jgi:hypothetical protein
LTKRVMTGSSAEYLFAPNLHIADRAARKQGWHAYGRTGWIKPDGGEVYFISLPEQLAAIDRHATFYFVGELSPKVRRLDRNWVKLSA